MGGRTTADRIFRNALLPVVTVAGIQVGQVLAGAILVETVFGWPGMGRLALESILRRDYPLLLGLLALVVATAALGPTIYPSDPWQMHGQRFVAPGQGFPLGTDHLGRDVLAGIIQGARVSLAVGAAATAIILALGVAIFGASVWTVVAAIGVSNWAGTARLVRAEFLSLREREFVTAARALGAPDPRIILREVLPNSLPPVIVNASLMVGVAILFASRTYLREAWWTVTFPGLAIVATVLALSLVGDWLNDVLSPRRRGRH